MAIAKVQEKGYSPPSVSSFSTSGMSNFIVGNTVIVNFAGSKGAKVKAITGGGVAEWKKAVIAENGEKPEDGAELWYGVVTSSGVNVITVEWTAATTAFDPLVVSEWSGVGALDKTTTNSGKSATMSTTKAKPATSGNLFICIGRILTESKSGTPTGGWTEMSSAGHTGNASAFIIAAGSGEEATSWSLTSDFWAMAMATFSPASGVPVITKPANQTYDLTNAIPTLTVAATNTPTSWEATVAHPLPSALAINAEGKITGKPEAAVGTYTVGLIATNGSGPSAEVTFTITIVAKIVLEKPAEQTSEEGKAITKKQLGEIKASTGVAPFTYTAVSGFPPGITVKANGEVEGTPTAAGTYESCKLQAEDAEGITSSKTFKWVVSAAGGGTAPVLTNPGPQTNKVGDKPSVTIVNSGGAPTITSYAGVPSQVPGTSMSAGLVISGTLTTAGVYTITVEAGNEAGSSSVTFTWTVEALPTVTGVSPSTGATGGGTSVAITGTNFTGVTAVKFGATAAASFTVVSSTSIEATAPAHVPGTVDVTATNTAGTSATSASDHFTFAEVIVAGPVVPGVRQQEVLQPGRYTLRHMAPQQLEEGEPGILAPLGAGVQVLGQLLFAESLPTSRLPDSPDFHEGAYTLRMLDAGEFTVTFPNRDASDGQPWRSRFSAQGHREFIEIGREGEVETVGVIVKIQKDRQKIVVTGFDGIFLLRKAYEQEWTGVIAPRDMIERYSFVSVATILTAFALGTPLTGNVPPLANVATQGAGTGTASAVIGPSGGLLMKVAGALSPNFGKVFVSGAVASVPLNGRWRAIAVFDALKFGAGSSCVFTLKLEGASTASCAINAFISATAITVSVNSTAFGSSSIIQSTSATNGLGSHTLAMECDGRWVSFYFDGELIAVLPTAPSAEAATVSFIMKTDAGSEGEDEALLTRFMLSQAQPFLMRGSAKGDYVLPGSASTYPTGGLHGRYLVQGATTTTEQWWQRILAPDPRRSGFPTYLEDQQSTINNPTPAGVPTEYWAARWFGAIYLDFTSGSDIEIQIKNLDDGCRLWIGKTQWGQQCIDDWNAGAAREKTCKLKASDLGQVKGWFPIILEYFQVAAPGGIQLALKAPVGWFDPGGTAIVGGSLIAPIPSTSLSPLGCVDARVQGSSFYDLVLNTAKDFGFQLRAEARTLESSEFPCQIIPKSRVGIETDEIVETDDRDQRSGINNWTVTEDATDSVASLKAFGSGIADGKGSQIAYEAISIAEEIADLFDLQGYLSAGDIAFPALLAARAEAERAIRAGVWQNIEGDPLARDRLADTFPLTGALNAFRWQPGDGVRLWLPEGSVRDTSNRQLMQIVRSFNAEGRTNSSAGFRPRPKDPVVAMRAALREVSRPQRAFQRQYVSRSGTFIQASALAAGATTAPSICTLLPHEQVVAAYVTIPLNASLKSHKLLVNGEDRTSALGGPWSSTTTVNILPYAVPVSGAAGQRLYVQLVNGAEVQTEIDFQLILTLLV